MRETLAKLLSSTVAIATVLGGAIYAVIWNSYVAYYREFGLSPSDVGLGQAEVVRTAAVALALFVGLAVPACVCWWFATGLVVKFGHWRLGRHRPRDAEEASAHESPMGDDIALAEHLDPVKGDGSVEPSPRWRRVFERRTLAVVGGSLLLPFVTLWFNNYIFWRPYIFFVMSGVGAVILASLVCALSGDEPWSQTVTVIGAWMAAAGIVFLSIAYFLDARTVGLANDLISDGYPNDRFFIFQFREDPVCVGQSKHLHFFYLMGGGTQGIVLFDPRTRKAIRPTNIPPMQFQGSRTPSC